MPEEQRPKFDLQKYQAVIDEVIKEANEVEIKSQEELVSILKLALASGRTALKRVYFAETDIEILTTNTEFLHEQLKEQDATIKNMLESSRQLLQETSLLRDSHESQKKDVGVAVTAAQRALKLAFLLVALGLIGIAAYSWSVLSEGWKIAMVSIVGTMIATQLYEGAAEWIRSSRINSR